LNYLLAKKVVLSLLNALAPGGLTSQGQALQETRPRGPVGPCSLWPFWRCYSGCPAQSSPPQALPAPSVPKSNIANWRCDSPDAASPRTAPEREEIPQALATGPKNLPLRAGAAPAGTTGAAPLFATGAPGKWQNGRPNGPPGPVAGEVFGRSGTCTRDQRSRAVRSSPIGLGRGMALDREPRGGWTGILRSSIRTARSTRRLFRKPPSACYRTRFRLGWNGCFLPFGCCARSSRASGSSRSNLETRCHAPPALLRHLCPRY
jgi:hypothetical protein